MQPGLLLRILASSVLLILSFPQPEFGFLSLVAFVPLFSILTHASIKRAFLLGWCFGTAWFFVSYNWVSHSLIHFGNIPYLAAEAAILLLGGIHGFYVGLFSLLIPVVSGGTGKGVWEYEGTGAARIDSVGVSGYRGIGGIHKFQNLILTHPFTPLLVLPSAWVLLEVARSWFPAPFPWLLLGSAARNIPFSGSLFELTGVYGVSCWILAVNVLVWKVFFADKNKQAQKVVALVFVLLLPAILYPLSAHDTGERLRVGVVQGNFPQEIKWDENLKEETVETYLSLTDDAVQRGAQLVVWPETAIPSFYQAELDLVERLKTFTSDRGVHLIFGSPGYEISGREVLLYNRVYYLAPGGKEEFYNKVRLVPFGEYVPFSKIIPFVDRMVPGEGEFARGYWNGPFKTPIPCGVLVCYEISFPSLARREVRDGSRFLVNVTNDAWFGRSWGPYQHLAISSIRAMENRTPVLRAANTGISAIINRSGQILESVPLNKKGVIVADIETAAGQTFYTRFGDWIVILCAAVLSLYFLVLFNLTTSQKGSSRRLKGVHTQGVIPRQTE